MAGTHIRLSGGSDLNTASIKYFLVKDDDGGMPRRESQERVRSLRLYDSEVGQK